VATGSAARGRARNRGRQRPPSTLARPTLIGRDAQGGQHGRARGARGGQQRSAPAGGRLARGRHGGDGRHTAAGRAGGGTREGRVAGEHGARRLRAAPDPEETSHPPRPLPSSLLQERFDAARQDVPRAR